LDADHPSTGVNLPRRNTLSRGESLVRLQRKGGKAGETSVSNARTALLKREQIVRRERKYRVE